MPDDSGAVTVRIIDRIDQVRADRWDACAGASNPFVNHAFLDALESSGSVKAETGWMPQHLIVEDPAGGVLGCTPLYLKGHSYGEYVFDWGWADAYERAGGQYYPKLQSAIPFTPVTGPRLLVRPGADAAGVRATLISAMRQVAAQYGVSSLHVTFCPEPEWREFGAHDFLMREGHQYHWENRGYDSFDDFLAALSSRKRKTIKRERREAAACGLTVSAKTGADLRDEHWDAFYRFYRNTSDRKWGQAYLTREFFHRLGDAMADRVALILAFDGDRPVAAALNLVGDDALYGRNWGCEDAHKFLHFELCYYRAIDFAIERRLARVEAGAQGPHKIQRGYLPVTTYSAHWVADPALRDAVENFLRRERQSNQWEMATLDRHTPYRRDDG